MGSGADIGDALHGLEEFLFCVFISGVWPCGIEAASVLELVICVKAVNIGRADGIIGAGDLLSVIEEIGEGEVVIAGKFLHVFEAVFGVFNRVVGHDGGNADPLILESFCRFDKTLDDCVYVWAVIADKGDNRAFSSFDVSVGEHFPVDIFESEIGRGQAIVFFRSVE